MNEISTNEKRSEKLFVRNLSWSVTEYDLQELFASVGEVVSVKIPTRREDGKSRGFAFVEMGSQNLAQQVIEQFNGYALDNRELVVDFQDENRAGGGHSSEKPAQSTKLFIRSIAYSVTEYDLQTLFQQAGSVVSVKIPIDRDTGEQKSFAFVEMGSIEEAQQAVDTLNNTPLKGKEISVNFQDLNRGRQKARQGGGYRGSGGGYHQGHGW
ncbi:MAG: hypothetical protein AAGI66_10110 [Cyanobacteria bacterium P01_H01_bin.74]